MQIDELKSYLHNQILQSSRVLAGYTKDKEGKDLPKRAIYVKMEELASNFLDKHSQEPRIVILPGLRGVGKTTLLAQLFESLSNQNLYKLYLSVDEMVKRFELDLWQVMETYEELINQHIEALDKPIVFFLDEIHYDKKWASFLKSIYDRSKKILVYCTGSAALLLKEQTSADLARRVFFLEVPPVAFSEYLLLKEKKPVNVKAGEGIKNALLYASSAKDLFEKLKIVEKEVNAYWLDVDRLELSRYLKLGTFPFTLEAQNETLSLDYIGQTVDKIVYTDVPQFFNFDIATLNKVERILYLLADSGNISLTRLSGLLEIRKDTLALLLKALEKSGLLTRFMPYGAHYKQVRKPSKYLFATPAIRYFFLSSKDSTRPFAVYKGSLLEDTIGMYLNRFLPKSGSFSTTYDVSEGGADFIIGSINKKIVIEVGFAKKGIKQVKNTLQRINGTYGLVVAETKLSWEKNIVKMPLTYFLLI